MISLELITDSKIEVVSEIFRDIAQVVFAVVVISGLISGGSIGMVLFGLMLSLIFWLLSLLSIK